MQSVVSGEPGCRLEGCRYHDAGHHPQAAPSDLTRGGRAERTPGIAPWGGMKRVHGLVVGEDEVLPMHVPTATDQLPHARFQSLLSVAESITSCRELEDLFRRLVGQLQSVVSFDFLGLVVYEPERGVARTRVLETASM